MRAYFATYAVAAFSITVLAGCDKSEAYLAVAREQVQAQEDLANCLAGLPDQAALEAASEQLRVLFHRFETIKKKAGALPQKPSAAVEERLREELGERMQGVLGKLARESARISQLPGGRELLENLGRP
jgi:hypothetical protein